jgi:tRNA pseudouridine38-40 synthase
MVRNMVGTALDVCRGRLSEKAFFQLLGPRLNKPDNCGVAITRSENPCKPAPPQGLTLEMVYYDKDSF